MTLTIIGIAAALLCAALIRVLFPLLKRYALARPNARSSHKIPTPQGAGIAVILAIIICGAGGLVSAGLAIDKGIISLIAAIVLLAGVGLVDDLRPLPALPRLLLQAVAVGMIVYISIPATFGLARLVPMLPYEMERGLILIAGIWFVNLTNFMDGLDWMSVAELVPVSLALTAFLFWKGDTTGAILAAVLAGAMLGFAPFNKPVAKVFLGDVGSLPLGLLTGFLLYRLALQGEMAAAMILPLYYIMDATITLVRRLIAREPVWQAHRTHFYQRAIDNGFSVRGVIWYVLILNTGLAFCATFSISYSSPEINFLMFLMAIIAISSLLYKMSNNIIIETMN